jgi:hypothetical protein
VVGGWWLVVGGWWLVVGGCRLRSFVRCGNRSQQGGAVNRVFASAISNAHGMPKRRCTNGPDHLEKHMHL